MKNNEVASPHSVAKSTQVVLYDGVCNLCTSTVRFILPRDPRGVFRFASLQGNQGEALAHSAVKGDPLESLVLLQDGHAYRYSSAVLRIVRHLKFPWNLLAIFWIIPVPIRDAVYRWVARNRYRWFGKQESCLLPRPEWKSRFLD